MNVKKKKEKKGGGGEKKKKMTPNNIQNLCEKSSDCKVSQRTLNAFDRCKLYSMIQSFWDYKQFKL